MSPEERHPKLVNMSDEDIDYSDIPELDEEFFKNAKLVQRKPATKAIPLRERQKAKGKSKLEEGFSFYECPNQNT